MGRCACVLLVAAGCLQPRYETCGDVICPTDSVCLATNECVSAEAVSACVGLADGTACKTSLFDGACLGGACRVPRCGDGIVEPPEQCDGAIPSGLDCVDYGFDLGLPTCSSVCTLDVIGSCIRFGWRRVLSTTAYAMWTDGTRFAVVGFDQTSVDVYTGGQLVLSATPADMSSVIGVTGKGSTIAAWTSASDLLVSQNGGAFATLDTSTLPAGSNITQIAIADDAAMYALVNNNDCEVFEAKAGQSFVHIYTNPDATACIMLDTNAGRVLLATTGSSSTGVVLSWNGTAWSTLFTTPSQIEDLESVGSVVWAGTMGDGAIRFENGTTTTVGTGEAAQAVPIGADLYISLGSAMLRVVDGYFDDVASPIFGAFFTDGKHLYVFGAGVYVWTGLDYGQRFGLQGLAQSIALLGDGSIAAAQDGSLWLPKNDGDNWIQVVTAAQGASITGASAKDIYIGDTALLDHFDGTTVRPVTPPPLGASQMQSMWAPPSGTPALYVVGTMHLAYAMSASGAWSAIAPPANGSGCDLAGVTGSGTTVLAVGACGTSGVVWQLAGASWTEIYRASRPFAAIAIDAAGDVFAAGPRGGARYVGGAWSDDDGAVGTSIAATSPSDVWIGGGPEELIHWDGASWSRLGVLGADSPQVVATPREVFFVGATQSSVVR